MNFDFFQELNEDPLFQDAAVYARTVTTAAGLPHIVDEAIRRAFAAHGPAVVVIPNDLPGEEISANGYYSAAANFARPKLAAGSDEQVDAALALIQAAKKPVMYVGQGTIGAASTVETVSEKLQLPVITTALGKEIIPYEFPALLGSATRRCWANGTTPMSPFWPTLSRPCRNCWTAVPPRLPLADTRQTRIMSPIGINTTIT